jgi:acyl-CoA dehydrogenase
MNVIISTKVNDLIMTARDFVINECIPAESIYDAELDADGPEAKIPKIMETLKSRAKNLGLWNLFLTTQYSSFGG